jgi:hypothetical protein
MKPKGRRLPGGMQRTRRKFRPTSGKLKVSEKMESSSEDISEGSSKGVRLSAGVVIAGALICAIYLYYSTQVCDQQLTQSGAVVNVCRRLQVADPPVVLIGLVALVALTAFFSEISGFGFSLKRDVQRANKKASIAVSRATSAQSAAQSARQVSEVAENVSINAASSQGGRAVRDGAGEAQAAVERMADEYNQVRKDELSGSARTSKMTTIVSNMIAALSGIASDAFDVTGHLGQQADDGRRLAAYAYLYANPSPEFSPLLVSAILADPTRFGQYWGIRALRKQVAKDPSALDMNTRRRLERYFADLGPNTDRAYELREVLSEAEDKV